MQDVHELSHGQLVTLVQRMATEIAALRQENDLLRSQLRAKGPGSGLPPFVKPNRPAKPAGKKAQRKKRTQSFVRRREMPTHRVEHHLEHCPKCGGCLSRETAHRTRQVVDIVFVPVNITEHVLYRGYCPACDKWHLAKVGAADGVVGKHRVGIHLMSLIATLNKVCRVTQRGIQRLLKTLYGVHISLGEITAILQAVAKWGKGEVEKILAQVRGSPVVHADETGWRQDGRNGYVWVACTQTARYFRIAMSRAGAVIQEILGDDFAGTLVTDGYSGYNWYLGPRELCWVHILRELHDLKEEHKENTSVVRWTCAVTALYREAKAVDWSIVKESERHSRANRYEARLLKLLEPYLKDREAPQHAPSAHMHRHIKHLFTFVRRPEVPTDNNPAERALRPVVIARKVSGGTRSESGSDTTSVLQTLFSTWQMRGQDPLQECIQMVLAVATST